MSDEPKKLSVEFVRRMNEPVFLETFMMWLWEGRKGVPGVLYQVSPKDLPAFWKFIEHQFGDTAVIEVLKKIQFVSINVVTYELRGVYKGGVEKLQFVFGYSEKAAIPNLSVLKALLTISADKEMNVSSVLHQENLRKVLK